jgi:hypothetical protein
MTQRRTVIGLFVVLALFFGFANITGQDQSRGGVRGVLADIGNIGVPVVAVILLVIAVVAFRQRHQRAL